MDSCRPSQFGIIAHPVEHSLSPRLYGAAFEALEMDAKFEMFDVEAENLGEFFVSMRGNEISGVAVSLPHKETCMPFLDGVDVVAQKIGAVNTVKNDGGILTGFNTDWIGIRDSLAEVCDISGRDVLIVGAGGAARAAVFACALGDANVTVTNRTFEKAQSLAADFGAEAVEMEKTAFMKGKFDVVVNTTTVGLHGEMLPLKADILKKNGVAFDIVYVRDGLTPWLQEMKNQGLYIIPGQEMLLHQAFIQFEILTEKEAPIDVMRKAL